MANNTKIRGITIELSADTQGISEGLKEVRSSLSQTQKSLKDVDKLLKFNPSNTDLLKQKQEYLGKAVQDTRKKLEEEKKLLEQLQNAGNSDKTREQQNALQREIIETTNKLKDLEKQSKEAASVLGTKMQEAGKKLQEVGQKISSVGNKLTVGVTAPIVAAATAAAKFASDYDENLNKVEASFGDAADSVKKWATTATESFGMSESAALELTAQFGDMGTSMGLSNEEAAQMSTSLAGLAGDLASFKNISTDRAMNALTGIFTGQTKALQGLGVVMNEVNLTKFAEDQGKVYKQMSEAERVMLRYQYVMSRTKNAQGDYARTSDGAANSLRTLKASLENLAVTLGKEVLPLITPLIQKLTEGIKKLNEMDPKTKKLVTTLLGIAAAIGPILSIGGKAVSLVGSFTAAFGKLNTVMMANPILAVVAAITALVGALAAYEFGADSASNRMIALNKEVKEANDAFNETNEAIKTEQTDVKNLTERVKELNKKEHLSNAEKTQMAAMVQQLNKLMPELNLEIDKQTGKLTQNTAALEKNFEAALKKYNLEKDQERMTAALEHYNEQLERRAEAESRIAEYQAELAKYQEMEASSGSFGTYQNTIDDLTIALNEAYKAFADASVGAAMAENEYAGLADTVEEVNEAVVVSTESVRSNIPAWNELSASQRASAEAVGQAYTNMKNAVIDSIQAQMDMFEEFEQAEAMGTEELLSNMQSQVDGVRDWEQNLTTLADRGINQNLLQYLLEMGPKGSRYVQSFVNMSDEEFARANALWQESLDIKGLTDEIGQGLTDGLADVAGQMDETGLNLAQGLARGISSGKALVIAAAKDMAHATIDTTRNVMGVASPSKVFKWIGEMTGLGFEQGLKDSFGSADKWLSNELSSFSAPKIDNAAIYNAIRSGAGDASINVYLDDRELTRGLKGLGVSFA